MHHLTAVHRKNPLKLQHSQTNLKLPSSLLKVAEEAEVAEEVVVDVVDTNNPPALEVAAKSICVLTTSASLWEKIFMSSSTH